MLLFRLLSFTTWETWKVKSAFVTFFESKHKETLEKLSKGEKIDDNLKNKIGSALEGFNKERF